MENRTCCFTGHREISETELKTVKTKIKHEVRLLIDKGVIFFGAGGARGFDTLAAEAVLELKELYPYIKLILILPCANQTLGWSAGDIERYNNIKSKADKIRILSQTYYNGCMHARNRHMVDCSGYCICYLRKNTGGTAYTVNYAKQRGVTVVYI